MSEQTYITCAETAKHVRRALAEAFPNHKFGVRSKVYSGGASIRVEWVDGPTTTEVERIVKRFQGADFDGSIDLQTYRYHYMLPDGTIVYGGTPGTEGSGGTLRSEHHKRPEGAISVHMGANHVFCDRQYSAAFLTPVAQSIAKKYGIPVPAVVGSPHSGAYVEHDWQPVVPGSGDDAATLVQREASKTSAYRR